MLVLAPNFVHKQDQQLIFVSGFIFNSTIIIYNIIYNIITCNDDFALIVTRVTSKFFGALNVDGTSF